MFVKPRPELGQKQTKPVDYKMQSPIQTAPNYDKLSRTERWVGRHLAGFADGTVGKALQRFNESWAGKALQYLDIPAETVERTAGLGAQLIYAYAGGNKLDPAAANDVLNNINAAWYAGSLAADMANFSPQFDPKTQTYKIPHDLPGISGLIDARQKISEYMQQGMPGDEALAKVRDEYYNSQGALALRGQMQDMFTHVFGDPLNIILPSLKPVERAAEFRTLLRSKVLGQTVEEVATKAGGIADDIERTQKALSETSNFEEITALDHKLKGLLKQQPIIEEKLRYAMENKLTPFQEKMVEFFKLTPDAEMPNVEEMSKLGQLAYRLNPLALTPGSRAHELMNTILQRAQTTIFHSGGGPNEWARAIDRAASGVHTPELAHMELTIEGRAVIDALKRANAEVQGAVNDFNKLEKFENPFIRNLSEALGTTPDKIVRRVVNNEEVSMASQYMKKLMSLEPEQRAPVEMLFRANGMQLNEQNLLDSIGRLGIYKDFVGWSDQMMQFEVANRIIDGVQQMALSRFGLQARGTIYQVAEAMKAAESLAFLKMNPAYPLRNWANNFFTTIARGTYGNPTPGIYDDFFKLHDLPEPPRLRSGVGMSGEIDFTAASERSLTASLEKGSEWIRRMENPQTGKIGALTKWFQKRRGLGFGQLAQAFERQASVRAYTAGFIRYYKQMNRVGAGLTSIEQFSPELARALGSDTVRNIQKAVEKAYTHANIDNIVFNKNLRLNMDAVLEDVSQSMGMDVNRILNDDFTEYMRPRLEEAMQKGTASFQEEMNNMRSLVQDQIDSQIEETNFVIMHETASMVNAETAGAMPTVFTGLIDDKIAADSRHAMDMAKIRNDLMALPGDSRKAFWDNLLSDNEKFYNRFWSRGDSYVKGVEKGLDDAMEQMRLGGTLTPGIEKGLQDIKTELRGAYDTWSGRTKDYFEYRNNEYKRMSRFKNQDNFAEAWDNLQIDLDKRYEKLMDMEHEQLMKMDEIVSRGLPEDQRNMFLMYRSKVAAIRRELRTNTLEFRRAVREVPQEMRATLWQDKFWPERLDIIRRMETAQRDVRVAMQGNVNAQHLMGLTQQEAGKIGDIQRRFLLGADLSPEDTSLLNRVRASIQENTDLANLRNQWGTYSKRKMQTYFTQVQSGIRGQPVLDEGVRVLGVGTGAGLKNPTPAELEQFTLNWAEENAPKDFERLQQIANPDQQVLPGTEKALQEEKAAIEGKLLDQMRLEFFTPSEAAKLWTEGAVGKEQFVNAARSHPDELKKVQSLTQWQLKENGVTVVKGYYNAADLNTAKVGTFDRLTLDRNAAKYPTDGQVLEIEVPVDNVLVHPSAHPGMDDEIILSQDGINQAKIATIDGRSVTTPEFNLLLKNNPTIAGAPATMSAMNDFHGVVPEQLLLGKGIDELWFTRGASAMDAIERAGLDAINKPALSVNVPENMRGQLMGYLERVKGEQSRNLYAGYRMGEWHRDTALLNYNRRTNFNNWLGAIVPYEFWATNTAWRWALHSIDRPAMLTNFLRMRKFLATAYSPQKGFPSRLQGSIRVPMPFLPDWMGKDVFIDPLRTFLPFDQMMYGVERYAAQQKSDMGKAERVLEELHNDNKITDQEYQQALATHQGATWDRAMALGQQDDTENRIDAFDTVSMMLSPHAPIMWAHNIARGTPDQISPFLPITRDIRGVSALLGINADNGGVNPEASIRKALGLPAFDKWDDYRIDRMLSNMAANGEYSLEQVKNAMIARKGEVFIEARRRAGIEYGWGSLGSMLAMPIKSYPTGEEKQRDLQTQYQAAWRNYEAGQVGAVQQFYNDHPEYEARLALWDKPDDRLRRFMVDELWSRWHDMPKVNQDEVKNHLGALFQSAFLDKATRNTDAIDLNTLQYWVSIMGGKPPGKLELSPNTPPLEMTDKDTAYRVQVFYDARQRQFDYYNKIAPLQNDYYKLQEGAARREFRNSHPELVNYWNWRRDFMQRNPDLAPFITDNPDQLPKYSSENQLRQVQAAQPMFTPAEWENYLGQHLYRLVLDDAPLPPTAQRALDQLGVSQAQVRQQIEAQLP